jgi:hypothetical protein
VIGEELFTIWATVSVSGVIALGGKDFFDQELASYYSCSIILA